MKFEKLLDIFKNVSNYEELDFILKVIICNRLHLINKNNHIINGYDFVEYSETECVALKLYCGISRRIKYKNLQKNFYIKNPNEKCELDVNGIKIPNGLISNILVLKRISNEMLLKGENL